VPAPQLSQQDLQRINTIVSSVAQDPKNLTQENYQQLWQIFARNRLSYEQVEIIRDQAAGYLTRYMPMFWRDALKALEKGRPYKSYKRLAFEKKWPHLKKHFRETDRLMKGIGNQKPIQVQGKTVVINRDMVQQSRAQTEAVAQGLNRLFSPPQ
jgi:hypothetical protein